MKFALAAVFAAGGFAVLPTQAAAPAKPDKVTTCAACHGENGVSTSPAFPNLAGQQGSYIEHALHAYKTGTRKNAIMSPQAMTLSDADIKQLAAWYSSQAPVLFTLDPEAGEVGGDGKK